jgi:hypothetical protein
MKPGDRELYEKVFNLIEAANALEPPTADETPSTPLVGAMLQTLTNERVIALLRVVRDHPAATMMSRPLSKRSSLFDKLIIMKGEAADWVLRLHTYSMPAPTTDGRRTTNLGEELQDDEENTHFHRWRLSSRFVAGGFNNVTWDVRDPKGVHGAESARVGDPVGGGKLLHRYALQPTAKSGASSTGRAATEIGVDVVSARRTEFYQAGDVIAYPIVDPHSVSMLSPFTGTTMTLAHTGKGLLDDSAFFAADNRQAVQQLSYSADEFKAAIDMAITRLQVIELNRSLMASSRVFRHLNAFETEVLPRLAEWVVLAVINPAPGPIDAYGTAAKVDFNREQANRLIEMDARSLATLIIESQKGLEAQQFAKDARPLLEGDIPSTDLARRALGSRLGGTEPVNLIGKHK